MIKKIHYVIEACLLVVVLILGGMILKNYKKENQVVAKIGEEELTMKDVQKKLLGKPYDTAVDNLINSSLIDQQFIKEKGEIADKDRILQFPYIKLADSTKKNLSEKDTKEYVDEYLKVKFLAQKFQLITEEEIENFLEEEKQSFGTKISKIKVFEGEHNQLSEFESELEKGKQINKVAEDLDINGENEEVFSSYNEYGIDFTEMKQGEYKHNMNDSNISHESSHNHGSKHQIIYLYKTQSVNKNLYNVKKNKSMILNVYFSKNYNNIRAKLLNNLMNNYDIKK
ncbi:hypothetical protein NJE56_15205 [Bacillus pumilus]|uniref:hypothetical protein n=1 Tax=Bacillus pumilus TaxID=1408 RepID=UPI0029C3C0DF|nr:hypothetical protein [Bacillus pumilus]MDX5486308.1 hypothetical protein [Bacillus pumilus]